MSTKFFIYGHRGAKGVITENTIESIEYAIDQGVPGIEIDCQPCADTDIIFHDRSVLSGDQMVPVSALSKSVLETNTRIQHIPSLYEVLRYADKVILNVEWKCESISSSAISIVEKFILDNPTASYNLVFSSFSLPLLMQLKDKFPNIRRAPLLYGLPLDIRPIINVIEPFALHLSKDFLTDQMILDTKQAGIGVFVYTVNCSVEARALYRRGVTGIFTDFPDRFTTSDF